MRQLLLFMLLALATLLTLFTSVCSAGLIVVVIGSSAHEHFTYEVVGKFLPEPRKVTENEDSRHLTVWSRTKPLSQLENAFIRTLHSPTLNASTVMLSKLRADEMSLDHLQIFFEIIKTEKDLVVVEIGDETVQTRALLDKAVLCWGQAKLQIEVPHRAYLCNNVKPTSIPSLFMTEIDNFSRDLTIQMEQPKPFWPCLFASATRTVRHPVKEFVEVEDNEDESNDNSKKNEDDDEEKNDSEEKSSTEDDNDNDETEKTVKKIGLTDAFQNKLKCKYRISCYATGFVPKIENRWGFSLEEDTIEEVNEEDKEEQAGNNDNNVVALKLRCKYRHKCYRENNIPIKDKAEEKDISFFSGKISAPQGKKRTIKEIAEKTIEKVKAREEEAADREISASIIVEKKLNEIEEKMKQKLKCKYRNSCYESGIVPYIEKPSLSFFPTSDSQTIEEKVLFEDRDELDKKIFCKYRKSCYESGDPPVIERIEYFASLEDIAEIETRKIPIQEKCKYRKSCYETGLIPDLSPPIIVSKKEVESAIPTSMSSLKEFCKYRKSCYEYIASSDGVSTVKKIRQTRLLEKEAKKRHKNRRHRKNRLATIGEGYFRKETRKEKAAARTENIRRGGEMKRERMEKHSKETVEETKQKKRYASSKEDKPKEEKKVEEIPTIDFNKKAERKIKAVKKGKKHVKPEKEIVEETIATSEAYITEESTKKPSKKSKKSELIKQVNKIEPKDDTSTEVDDKNEYKQDFKENQPVEKKAKLMESTKQSLCGEKLNGDDSEKNDGKLIAKKLKKNLSKKQEHDAKEKEDEAMTVEASKQMGKTEHEKMDEEKKRQENANDFNSDEFESKKQQRQLCKYRKSCYKNGKLPQISRSYADVIKDIHTHVENQYQTELEIHFKEEDKKLKCKYRKSCYETGVLPEIISFSDFSQSRAPTFAEELSIQMKCKYRKSCYEKHGLKMEDVEETDIPPTKITKKEKIVEKKIPDAESEEMDKKRKDKQKRDEDIDEKGYTDTDVEEVTGHHQDVYGKLSCKYRRSCYATTPPRATREDHSNTMARQGQKTFFKRDHCHKYWYSCREQLGLPPKEKAPIGPNGKRLCRKKSRPQ